MKRLPFPTPWLRSGLAALCLAFVCAACGSTQFDYQRNTQVGAAFKVPDGWTTFDKSALLGLGPGVQPTTPDPIRWLVGFDDDPNAAASDVLSDHPDSSYPQGFALVESLTPQARDAISFGVLRNFPFPVDYFSEDDFRLISYNSSFNPPGGYRGLQMTYQFRASALAAARTAQSSGQAQNTAAQGGDARPPLLSPDFVQVQETALLDAKTNNAYYIVAWCSARCFQRNASSIAGAVQSWTVRS